MKTVTTAVVRHIPGTTGGWELLLDGEPFPFYLARQDLEVETLIDGDAPLRLMMLPVYVEQVVGAAEFNECLAEEADASRVRQADRRDLREAGFINFWNKVLAS